MAQKERSEGRYHFGRSPRKEGGTSSSRGPWGKSTWQPDGTIQFHNSVAEGSQQKSLLSSTRPTYDPLCAGKFFNRSKRSWSACN